MKQPLQGCFRRVNGPLENLLNPKRYHLPFRCPSFAEVFISRCLKSQPGVRMNVFLRLRISSLEILRRNLRETQNHDKIQNRYKMPREVHLKLEALLTARKMTQTELA